MNCPKNYVSSENALDLADEYDICFHIEDGFLNQYKDRENIELLPAALTSRGWAGWHGGWQETLVLILKMKGGRNDSEKTVTHVAVGGKSPFARLVRSIPCSAVPRLGFGSESKPHKNGHHDGRP